MLPSSVTLVNSLQWARRPCVESEKREQVLAAKAELALSLRGVSRYSKPRPRLLGRDLLSATPAAIVVVRLVTMTMQEA